MGLANTDQTASCGSKADHGQKQDPARRDIVGTGSNRATTLDTPESRKGPRRSRQPMPYPTPAWSIRKLEQARRNVCAVQQINPKRRLTHYRSMGVHRNEGGSRST